MKNLRLGVSMEIMSRVFAVMIKKNEDGIGEIGTYINKEFGFSEEDLKKLTKLGTEICNIAVQKANKKLN